MNVIDFYDKFAESYDQKISSPAINSKLMEEIKRLFDHQKISRGTILDVGCGTGILKLTLGDGFTYTGIDISPKMSKEAKKKGYHVHHGDMLAVLRNFESNSFDHVLCISAMYWVENGGELWSEMCRVARQSVTATLDKVCPIIEGHRFTVDETPIFDHSKMMLPNLTEDYEFSAWTSPTTGIRVFARMLFFKK